MTTWLVIGAMVAVLLLVRAIVPPPRRPQPPPVDAAPDEPRPFSYKTAWLAVKNISPEKLAAALGLENVRACNWRDGIAHAYERNAGRQFPSLDSAMNAEFGFGSRHDVFVSPPVAGWTFAVGERLAFFESFAFRNVLADRDPDRLIPFLEGVSRALQSPVQYFFTHRVPETHVWARADAGRVERAYGVSGELGRVILDVGSPTPEERALAFVLPGKGDGLHAEGQTSVDEDTVLEVAAKWSLSPRQLGTLEVERGVGLLGKMG